MADYTKEDLEKILQKDFHENRLAFTSGRRNDDAVDFSIICHCLGKDPMQEFRKLCIEHKLLESTRSLAEEHMERVQPYLSKWGEPGTMQAMVYCIDY